MLSIILAFLVVVYAVYYYRQYTTIWKYIDQIPGPKGLPLIGNSHQVGRTPYEFLHRLMKYCEEFNYEMFKMYIGNFPSVIISNPDDLEVVLSSNTLLEKSITYKFTYDWIGQGLLTSYGAKWHKHRKMITPSFHFTILVDFLNIMNENTAKFLVQLEEKAAKGDIFDIQDMFHYLALDIICDTSMGVNINAMGNHDSQMVKAVHNLCYTIQMRIQSLIRQNDFLFKLFPEYKEYKHSLDVFFKFQEEVMAKRKKILMEEQNNSSSTEEGSSRRKRVFLDTLLTATIDGKPLATKDIFDEVSTFMFEGHDTTTSGLSFTAFFLSRNPKIQEKVFEEQKLIYGDDLTRKSTYAEIQDMRYLEMVIKESQRLCPSVPFIGRGPQEFININGKIVPPGAVIFLNLISTGYNEKFFPDPYKMDPERFAPENISKRSHPYSYVPFSAGPRNCIGQKFAMLELKSVLSTIVRNFELLPAKDDLVFKDSYQKFEQNEYDPKFSAILTLKSDNGVLIRIRKRKI